MPKATKTGIQLDGTVAYAPQTEANADCQGAVDYWKSAVTSFGGRPPNYIKGKTPYEVAANVSFVALFNPQDKPTMDCAAVTCPTEPQSDDANGEPGDDAGVEEGRAYAGAGAVGNASGPSTSNRRRLSEASKATYGLVCLTNPKALEDTKAPFT